MKPSEETHIEYVLLLTFTEFNGLVFFLKHNHTDGMMISIGRSSTQAWLNRQRSGERLKALRQCSIIHLYKIIDGV